MFILLLITCCGVLWLAHRFSLLLSLPLELSVKALNIPIPKIPLISIDKITNNSLCIHWSTELEKNIDSSDKKNSSKYLNSSISHYLLYLNGLETCKIIGTSNKCTLENLKPNFNYQIDLVAFNQTGFRSKSSPVFIKTCTNEFNPNIKNLDDVVTLLTDKTNLQSIMKNYNSLPRITNEKPELIQLANEINQNNSNKILTLTEENPHLMEEPNDLKYLLESILAIIEENLKSFKAAEAEFKEERSNLLTTKQAAQERKNFEDANRSNLRSEIKFLEDQKVKNNSGVDSLNKKINDMIKKIELFNSKIDSWNLEIEKMDKSKKLLIQEQPRILAKLKDDINELNNEIILQQKKIHDAEDDVRNEISKRKILELQKIQISKIFKQINNNIDENTGLIKSEGLQYLNELIEHKPEWKDEIYEQLVFIDEKAEQDYKQLQQTEWLKFHEMKTKLDNQRLELLKTKDELSTTATNTTNVNGYFYNNNPLQSTNSNASLVINSNTSSNNLSQFNSNSLRNLMRPTITTTGSFQDLWGNSSSTVQQNNQTGTDNMLLPHNLINGEDSLFDSQSFNQFNPSLSSMIPPPPPSTTMSTMNSNMSNGLNFSINGSPNMSQINNFELYPTISSQQSQQQQQQQQQQQEPMHSTPQHNRITSLSSVLAANPSVNSSSNLMQPQLLSSPNTSDNLIIDPNHSPFNSFQHRSTHSNGSDFDPVSLLLAESNQHYGSIFGQEDNNDMNMNRARSSSFGSSIWSNGNNPNLQPGNWGSNGFSFLAQPITMTSNNEDIDRERKSHHERTPSFMKSMIGKLGASPTKTISNQTVENHQILTDDLDIELGTEKTPKNIRSGSSSSTGTSITPNNNINNSTKSSRFFKLGGGRKNSVASVSQQSNHSATSNSAPVILETEEPSPSSGFNIGRKLSFAAFKSSK